MSACVGWCAESSRSSVGSPGSHRVLYRAMRNAGREVHTDGSLKKVLRCYAMVLRYMLRFADWLSSLFIGVVRFRIGPTLTVCLDLVSIMAINLPEFHKRLLLWYNK